MILKSQYTSSIRAVFGPFLFCLPLLLRILAHPHGQSTIQYAYQGDGCVENQFEHTTLPLTSIMSGRGMDLVADVYYVTIQIANICFIGRPDGTQGWVLVDAGMPNSANRILNLARERFGADSAPQAIILTHGHFDHVGAIAELLHHWHVPVFAHRDELPFLTGQANYPKGDPTVGGGLVSLLSPLYPNHAIDLTDHVHALPDDGSIPGLEDWRFIHTPGHTKGHISLFRDSDKVLIAGDAFTTVKQESMYHVLVQDTELNGPPAYFTSDWMAAWESVRKLALLEPSASVTGHGRAMYGEELTSGLKDLAENFEQREIPKHGKAVPRELQ